jgi:hypothetical protein
MQQLALYDAVGAGEVDIFEDTQSFSRAAFRETSDPVFVYNHYFARFDFSDELRAGMTEGAAFRSDYPAAIDGAETKRSYSHRVTDSNQLVLGQYYQGIGSLQAAHGVFYLIYQSSFCGGNNEIGDNLGVGSGGKLVSQMTKLVAEEFGIDYVAVVS